MKKEKIINTENLILILFIIAGFIFYIFNLKDMYLVHMLDDELGYWSAAAHFAGLDWTSATTTIPYYSFGYSLIISPLFFFFKEPFSLYRGALVINSILTMLSFFISYRIFRRYFTNINKYFLMLICFATVLYPSFITSAVIGWSESFVTFCVWVTIFLFIKTLEKDSFIVSALFGLSTGFLYAAHQRTLGIIATCVLLILIAFIRKKVSLKQIMTFLCGLILMLIAFVLIKRHLCETVFIGTQAMNSNDFSGQLSKVKYIFTSKGFISTAFVLCGHIFYLGAATAVVVYLGIWENIKDAFLTIKNFFSKLFKKKDNDITDKNYFGCFLFFGSFSSCIISVIFMNNPLRLDQIVYGRYMEMIIAPVLIFGILSIINLSKKKIIPLIFSYFVFAGTGFVLHFTSNLFPDILTFNGICSVGIYRYFLKYGLSPFAIFKVVSVIFAVIILFSVFSSLPKLPKFKKYLSLGSVLVLFSVFVYMGEATVLNPIIPVQSYNSRLISVTESAEKLADNSPIYFYTSGILHGNRDKAMFQFLLIDTPLICVSNNDLDNDTCKKVVIAQNNDDNNNYLLSKNYIIADNQYEYSIWELKD